MWAVLSIIVFVMWVISVPNRNAIGGAVTVGFILGSATAIFYYFYDGAFRWSTIGKSVVVFSLIGMAIEIAYRMLKNLNKKQ